MKLASSRRVLSLKSRRSSPTTIKRRTSPKETPNLSAVTPDLQQRPLPLGQSQSLKVFWRIDVRELLFVSDETPLGFAEENHVALTREMS
jgi:hypothetical protein